ncbi:hypothetical protein DNTS_003177 [Danionella cerebrum]|uniref:Tubulin delta chain n=1 Tax=Danionella cerebrum TaxID=2873325 RepID=A0A553RJD1_9TELE|nr:hypothetical protein DNTS_003177 [Danionella translucida]
MSVVSLQLGQCGNQIGHELFSIISSDSNGPNRKKYGDKAHFSQKQGSGNNWANGFCVLGPRHEEVVEDLVRREIERSDRLAGIFTMMSVAGGTGSGVGTYITQCLRDLYPSAFILNQVTWPYGAGELSDAILVHENDTVHQICSRLMNITHISITDVNKVMAHQLASILQPAHTAHSGGQYCRNPLGELLTSLVCHPEYKLLSLCNIPQMSSTSLAYSVFNWPGLLKHLRQMLIATAKMEEGIDWTVSAPSVVRATEENGFKDPALYVPWLQTENSFSTWNSSVPLNGYEKSATLISNSQSLLKPLDSIVRKAWDMFASRAYVHQYTKFGISEEDFLDSFTALEQIISSYTHL